MHHRDGLNSSSHVTLMARPIGAPRFHFEEPNAGGGGGDTPPAKPGDTAPAGGPSPAPSGNIPPAGSAYRPEGMPDHFLGKDDRETVDKLFKAADGFRREAAERGTVPKEATAYAFETSEKLKPFVAGFDKDPVYNAARDIAHKAGMTDKVFQKFIPGFLESMIDNGMVGQSMNGDEMLVSLAPASMKDATPEEKKTAGAKRVTDTLAWVDGAKTQGNMPPAVADYLSTIAADDPKAIGLVDWLRGSAHEPRPAMQGGNVPGGTSEEALKARNLDPRNQPGGKQYDAAFAAETDRLYRAHYG